MQSDTESDTPAKSTAGALQHSQSVLEYISRAVRQGQELDQSFPVPNDVDDVQNFCVLVVGHPDLRAVEAQTSCRGGDTANNTSLKDETCLSIPAKYSLALINENLKHFVHTTKLQCFELPNFLNKGQKQKVSYKHAYARKQLCLVLQILFACKRCMKNIKTSIKLAHLKLYSRHCLSAVNTIMLAG